MKHIRHIATALLLCSSSLAGMAQAAKSAYFLDGTLYNYQLNPAMDSERAFFSLGIGNFSLKTNSNVGLSDFLYPYGEDKLTTFMSGAVDANDFLRNIPKSVRLSTDISLNVLTLGTRMLGGYTTLGITLNSAVSTNIPKGFFEFAKKGIQESTYNFSDINARTMNYAALTLGHSREIFDGFRAGINIKRLIGIGYANMHIDKLNLTLGENYWMVESHAYAEAAFFTEVETATDNQGKIDFEDTKLSTDINPASVGKSASGFGIDLGVVYDMKDIVEGLTVSASIVDLGRIKWDNMTRVATKNNKIEFNGFEEIDTEDFAGSVADELESLGEQAMNMVHFYPDGEHSMSTNLNTTIYLGAEYNMPFYKPLSVAMLYNKRFGKLTGWDECRGYINIAPNKFFEASANVGFSTFGTSLGWLINFHPAGLNFFIGSDHMITKVTPQFIPVNNLNGHVTLGLSLALGKRK